jgi:N-acetylglucosamine-6-sulfatase
LRRTGRLDNTYIFVLSDNGWHEGEHSIPRDKGTAYKEVFSPPMWVSGPIVRRGHTDLRLVGTHDLAPTIMRLANIPLPRWMDGRSIYPLLIGNTNAPWRTAMLGQSWSRYKWDAIQTDTNKKLVLWRDDGFLEYYDMTADPYERHNLINEPGRFQEALPLISRLYKLRNCGASGGVACRVAED